MRYWLTFIFCYLQENNKKIGISAGFGSGGMLVLTDIFTNEHFLKAMSGVGVCCSTFLAMMSVFAWFVKKLGPYLKKRIKP